jgi:hypothetical protein
MKEQAQLLKKYCSHPAATDGRPQGPLCLGDSVATPKIRNPQLTRSKVFQTVPSHFEKLYFFILPVWWP